MKPIRKKRNAGVSLIEVMVAITVLAVAALGASGYRYYSHLNARNADMQITAARIALLLCESWHGVNGDETYDPVAHLGSGLTITTVQRPDDLVSVEPEDFTLLGSYLLELDDKNYYAALYYKDVDTSLRALNVVVGWLKQHKTEVTLDDEGQLKLFELTTYALPDDDD